MKSRCFASDVNAAGTFAEFLFCRPDLGRAIIFLKSVSSDGAQQPLPRLLRGALWDCCCACPWRRGIDVLSTVYAVYLPYLALHPVECH